MAESPMFPLGTVLFPSMVLPLHVFEPRYRVMTTSCLEDDRPFGVVLIERGSEVGGGDQRTDVGTLARIVGAQPFPDGRWALVCAGTERIRVRSWLPDAPYPRADVVQWPDTDATLADSEVLREVKARLRAVLALASELGMPVPPATQDLSDDPSLGSLQAAALAPLGPADRQRLLAAPGPAERLSLLEGLLEEQQEMLEARLRMEAEPEPGD